MQPKIATLCFLRKKGSVLLAMKKRDFGEGKWNGAGGKVKPDETIADGALRELAEELGVRGARKDLMPAAFLTFRSTNPGLNWDVHVFVLDRWKGEPRETEEMRPAWFATDAAPFEAMWPDDRYWLPRVLAGVRVEADFTFDETGARVLRHDVRDVGQIR